VAVAFPDHPDPSTAAEYVERFNPNPQNVHSLSR
jgi:hypothetical protein